MSNAYMIRLELLKLAQSIESERILTERIRLENDWSTQREVAFNKISQGENLSLPPFPKLEIVDHERILKVAQELNKFVSNGEKLT